LNRAEARAHILEGFKIALKNLDEVVRIIRSSKDREQARTKLIAKFKFSDRQADAILDMRLYQLTGLEREKIDAEYKELLKKIAYYKSILASEQKVREIIKEELNGLKEKFADARRTDIIASTKELDVEDLIANEGCIITISHAGYIKRVPVGTYRTQRRGGKGVAGMDTREEDFVQHLFTASTHDYLMFFTTQGRCYWLKVYEVPTGSRTARGKAIVNLLDMSTDEKIADLIRVKDFEEGRGVLMVSSNGTVKKTDLSAFSNPRRTGIIAMDISGEDSLKAVKLTSGNDEIVLVTRQGQSIRFHENDVRFMGRSARGVKGITLKNKDDAVVGAEVVSERATLLAICENGHGKRTDFSEYRQQSRGGKGVIAIRTTKRNGMVVQALSVNDNDDIVITTASGTTIRMAVSDIRTIGRATQGVRIINLGKDNEGNIADRVVDVARMVSERGEEATAGVEGGTGEPGEGGPTGNDVDDKDESEE
jgi:DNA gyrase subunit A